MSIINEERWINTMLKKNHSPSDVNIINEEKWVSTIPKKNTYTSFKKYSLFKKYSFMILLFTCGLLFISTPVVKNKTRNLEKEINILQTSINLLKFNLEQAMLDNEVLTSPENISFLGKEYLNTNLTSYKRSQIKKLDFERETFAKLSEQQNLKINNKKKVVNDIKVQVSKKIEKKKKELKKLQELYSNPKSIPSETKAQIAKQIKEAKEELKDIYESPEKALLSFERVKNWGAVQIVKAFLGIPVIPGR